MGFVVGFSGKIGSGKTTYAQLAAAKYNILFVSFGNYVKEQARLRKLKPSRKAFQDLGQILYEEDPTKFVYNVLQYHDWNGHTSLVIDGIRHLKVNSILKKIVSPLPYFLIYIDTPDRERFIRIGGLDTKSLDSHPTEKAVQHNLAMAADFVIDGGENLVEISDKVSGLFGSLILEHGR